MQNCNQKLKELIENIIMPDIEEHIDGIFETIAKDKVADDAKKTELESIKQMKEEFETILDEIDKNELDSDECKEIYDDIMDMISE